MRNPAYYFRQMRALLNEFESSRERSLAQTKLDECELWLSRCMPTADALQRDQASSGPTGDELREQIQRDLAEGNLAAVHPCTTECDGFHGLGASECKLPQASQ